MIIYAIMFMTLISLVQRYFYKQSPVELEEIKVVQFNGEPKPFLLTPDMVKRGIEYPSKSQN